MLHTGVGPIRSRTYLPATTDNVMWGELPCARDRAVLTVDPGDEVTIDTISHEGILDDQGRDPRAFFAPYDVDVLDDAVALAASDRSHDDMHVVTGPIAVRGAEPGDLLAMTVVETLQRAPYGVISSRHGMGTLPNEMPTCGELFSVVTRVKDGMGTMPLRPGGPDEVRFPLAPFLGVMGVAAAGDVRPMSTPPGTYGGNLDINLLTVGATLYLPVQVPGALAYVGDPHFSQGDGEVSLTAFEAPLRATVRFSVTPREEAIRSFGELVGPLARTEEFLVPTGLDADLDRAMQNCLRAAIALLVARYRMHPDLAYAYLSAATDFNISQVVDLVKGVHAKIRLADFPPRS